MLLVPTTWRRNAMTIDVVEIMTSPYPVYILNITFIRNFVKYVRSSKLLAKHV